MNKEEYIRFLNDVESSFDQYMFQVKQTDGEWLMGKFVETKNPKLKLDDDTEVGGEPTVFTLAIHTKGKPTGERIVLTVQDIAKYEVYKDAYKTD